MKKFTPTHAYIIAVIVIMIIYGISLRLVHQNNADDIASAYRHGLEENIATVFANAEDTRVETFCDLRAEGLAEKNGDAEHFAERDRQLGDKFGAVRPVDPVREAPVYIVEKCDCSIDFANGVIKGRGECAEAEKMYPIIEKEEPVCVGLCAKPRMLRRIKP